MEAEALGVKAEPKPQGGVLLDPVRGKCPQKIDKQGGPLSSCHSSQEARDNGDSPSSHLTQ